MPVPTPRPKEKENEFVSRCMTALADEDKPTDQKLAICYQAWGDKTGGNPVAVAATDVHRVFQTPVRATEGPPGSARTFKSYGAIWGDEEHMDWYGTWFTRDTDFCLDWYNERPWIYGHGQNRFAGTQKLGTWKDHGLDDHGLFFLGELDARFEYLDEVEFLMEIGYLFPSSGTLSHIMRIADDGWIERWPVSELSSTVQPAEWRIPAQLGATASQRRKAAAAIRTLTGGLTMSEDVMARLVPGADLPSTPEPVALAPETPAREVEVVVGTFEDADAEDVVDADEGVAAEPPAPGELAEEEEVVDHVQAAIVALDNTLREAMELIGQQATRLAALEADRHPARVIRDAVDDPHWTTQLFSASRSGRTLTDEDGEPLAPSNPLLASLSAVGDVVGGDVMSAILNSQRR